MDCKHRELSRVGYGVWECQECNCLYSLDFTEVDGFMEEEDEEAEDEGETGDRDRRPPLDRTGKPAMLDQVRRDG